MSDVTLVGGGAILVGGVVMGVIPVGGGVMDVMMGVILEGGGVRGVPLVGYVVRGAGRRAPEGSGGWDCGAVGSCGCHSVDPCVVMRTRPHSGGSQGGWALSGGSGGDEGCGFLDPYNRTPSCPPSPAQSRCRSWVGWGAGFPGPDGVSAESAH